MPILLWTEIPGVSGAESRDGLHVVRGMNKREDAQEKDQVKIG